jgi:hypothetical protein
MPLKVKEWLENKNAQFEVVSSTCVFLIKKKQVVAPLSCYKAYGYLDGYTIELIHFNEDKIHVEYVCYHPDGKSVHHGDIVEADRIEVMGQDSLYICPQEATRG